MIHFIKEQKHFLMKAVNVCLIVGLCAGYQGIALVWAQKEAKIEKQNQEAAAVTAVWKDGVYEGSGTGFGGEIRVRVTIEESRISGIEILSADQEDTAYLDRAKTMIDDMIEGQTAEADTVSGATYSSNGIREAVGNALEEAAE